MTRWQLALYALGGGLCLPAVVGGSDMAGGRATVANLRAEPGPSAVSGSVAPEAGTPFPSPGHGPHVPFRVVAAPREIVL
ncbi:MAG: hypothetical protein ABUS79_23335, partial [Pseudomonadota bacterium]